MNPYLVDPPAISERQLALFQGVPMNVPEALHSSALTGGSDKWITPPEAINIIVERYGGIDLDACAEDDFAARAPLFITPEIDALKVSWREMAGQPDPHCYCNMPYSLTAEFIEKGWEESQKGCRVTFLINAATGTRAWHRRIFNGAFELGFGQGRFSFIAGEDIYAVAKSDFVTRYGEQARKGHTYLSVRKGDRGAPVKDNAIVHMMPGIYTPKLWTFSASLPRGAKKKSAAA